MLTYLYPSICIYLFMKECIVARHLFVINLVNLNK